MIVSSDHCIKLTLNHTPCLSPPLGLRLKSCITDANINLNSIAQTTIPSIPLWVLKHANFLFELHELGPKTDIPAERFLSKYNEMMSDFATYTQIFTDGSKEGNTASAAAVSQHSTRFRRLPDGASVFSAEACAVTLALDMIESMRSNDRFVIISDSMSILQALHGRKWENPIVLDILTRVHNMIADGKTVCFVWVPSHIGIRGNTQADAAAKVARLFPDVGFKVSHSDLKQQINSFMKSRWQLAWDSETRNKLHRIQPGVGTSVSVRGLSRREERTVHRVRIGHTYLTHAYLLRSEAPPICTACQMPLTIEHILISCPAFNHTRSKYFQSNTMDDLFKNSSNRTIIKFIKEIGMLHKI